MLHNSAGDYSLSDLQHNMLTGGLVVKLIKFKEEGNLPGKQDTSKMPQRALLTLDRVDALMQLIPAPSTFMRSYCLAHLMHMSAVSLDGTLSSECPQMLFRIQSEPSSLLWMLTSTGLHKLRCGSSCQFSRNNYVYYRNIVT